MFVRTQRLCVVLLALFSEEVQLLVAERGRLCGLKRAEEIKLLKATRQAAIVVVTKIREKAPAAHGEGVTLELL